MKRVLARKANNRLFRFYHALALFAGGIALLSGSLCVAHSSPVEAYPPRSQEGVFIPAFDISQPMQRQMRYGQDATFPQRNMPVTLLQPVDRVFQRFVSRANAHVFTVTHFMQPSPHAQVYAREQLWELLFQSTQLQYAVMRQYAGQMAAYQMSAQFMGFQNDMAEAMLPLNAFLHQCMSMPLVPMMPNGPMYGFPGEQSVPVMWSGSNMWSGSVMWSGSLMWSGSTGGPPVPMFGGMFDGTPSFPGSSFPGGPYYAPEEVVQLLQGRWEMISFADSGNQSEEVPSGVFFTFRGDTVALADCPDSEGIPYSVIMGGQALEVQVAPDSAVTWNLLTLDGTFLVFEEGSDVWTLEYRGACVQP